MESSYDLPIVPWAVFAWLFPQWFKISLWILKKSILCHICYSAFPNVLLSCLFCVVYIFLNIKLCILHDQIYQCFPWLISGCGSTYGRLPQSSTLTSTKWIIDIFPTPSSCLFLCYSKFIHKHWSISNSSLPQCNF